MLKLNKALYGLKQSARIWYNTLKDVLLNKLGFKPLLAENSIFINRTTGIIITVYVDDLAIIGPSIEAIQSFIKEIKNHFKIKDLGLIKDYLSIQLDYKPEQGYLKLYMGKYITKILERFNFSNINPSQTPMDANIKLEPNKEQAKPETIKYFQQLIGSLLYLALACRPDITFAVIKLARFASNPSELHLNAIKKVFRYLKGTINLGIIYTKNGASYIQGYCDADYAGDLAQAKSTTGYLLFLAGGVIMWKSKLQSIIAQSTTEAEYIAINAAAKEIAFIRALLEELKLFTQNKIPLYTDNNGALLLANNPVYHERTKHISVKYHLIRDYINKGMLDLIFIPTNSQKADGMTKPLAKIKFNEFITHLNLN